MTQLDLFTPRLAWIDDNPDAWALICDMARECVSRRKHFGMRWLLEVARFEMAVRRGAPYKLNNNDQAALGEALRATVPGAAALMEVRKRVAS